MNIFSTRTLFKKIYGFMCEDFKSIGQADADRIAGGAPLSGFPDRPVCGHLGPSSSVHLVFDSTDDM